MGQSNFCFYCGKTLKLGESCHCRYDHSPGDDLGCQQPHHQTDAPEKTACDPPVVIPLETGSDQQLDDASTKPLSDASIKTAEQNKSTASDQKKQPFSPKSSKVFSEKSGTFYRLIHHLRLFFIAPTEAIRRIRLGRFGCPICLILFKVIMFVFLILRMLGQNNLSNWLLVSTIRPNHIYALQAMIFLTICMLVLFLLSFTLFKVLIYKLTLRWIGGNKLSFKQVLFCIAPGQFYFGLFLFVAALVTMGTGSFSLFLVLSGMFSAMFADFIAFHQQTEHHIDRLMAIFIASVILLSFGMHLMIQVLLPNLTTINTYLVSELDQS